MQKVIRWFSCASIRVFLLLGQLVGEKDPNTQIMGKGTFLKK